MTVSIERLGALLCAEETPLTPLTVTTEKMDGYVQERLRFRLADGTALRGFLTRPDGAAGKSPCILYAHAHGGRYEIRCE